MTTIILCYRDPDASNGFDVFGDADVEIHDIDFGYADLTDHDELLEWSASHLEQSIRWQMKAMQLQGKARDDMIAAADALAATVSDQLRFREHTGVTFGTALDLACSYLD